KGSDDRCLSPPQCRRGVGSPLPAREIRDLSAEEPDPLRVGLGVQLTTADGCQASREATLVTVNGGFEVAIDCLLGVGEADAAGPPNTALIRTKAQGSPLQP